MRQGRIGRIRALVRKDAADLARNFGALLPAVSIALIAPVPAFLVAVITPRVSGEALEDSREFTEVALAAMAAMPELRGLEGAALVQAFVFHQFALMLLMVPVVGAMALAAHAVIGEKMTRALEPLLATPLTTTELLVAKVLTPLAFSIALMWGTLALYMAGAALVAAPGVWWTFVSLRTLLLFGAIGPLLGLVALLLAVIISSRVNDPRTAQQLGAFVVLPITLLLVLQLMGQFILELRGLLLASVALAVAGVVLLRTGVAVFDRERILTRWK